MGWIEGLIHLPFGSGAVSQSSSLPTKLWGGQVTLPAGAFNGEGGNNMIARAYPAGLVNQNNSACNCKSGYTGMPAQLNSGVSNMTVNYPQGTYFSGDCACIPTSSMSQLVNPSNNISLSKALGLKQLPPVYETNSSTSGGNNIMNTQSSTNTTASASSSSPVAPIQNLMNNWFAWGKQPTNVAGNEPTNTKAALNTMTNQWQFFPSQNTASANTALMATTTSTVSANASPQASNGLSEAAQEFEKAINSIFGNISNFLKNL